MQDFFYICWSLKIANEWWKNSGSVSINTLEGFHSEGILYQISFVSKAMFAAINKPSKWKSLNYSSSQKWDMVRLRLKIQKKWELDSFTWTDMARLRLKAWPSEALVDPSLKTKNSYVNSISNTNNNSNTLSIYFNILHI